jgi:hypothetical protein
MCTASEASFLPYASVMAVYLFAINVQIVSGTAIMAFQSATKREEGIACEP